MSFRFHRERKQQVKFIEDSDDSATRRSNMPVTESMKSSREGPFFPNLQLMFKNKQHESTEHTEEEVVMAKTSEEKAISGTSAAPNEDDIDTVANEYIKRKHHNLYLQKLMSMNAAAA